MAKHVRTLMVVLAAAVAGLTACGGPLEEQEPNVAERSQALDITAPPPKREIVCCFGSACSHQSLGGCMGGLLSYCALADHAAGRGDGTVTCGNGVCACSSGN